MCIPKLVLTSKNFLKHSLKLPRFREISLNILFHVSQWNFRCRVYLKWGTPYYKPWEDNLPFQEIKNKKFISEWFQVVEMLSTNLQATSPLHQGPCPRRPTTTVFIWAMSFQHTLCQVFWTLAEQEHSTGTAGLAGDPDLPCWGRLEKPTEKPCPPTKDYSVRTTSNQISRPSITIQAIVFHSYYFSKLCRDSASI